MCAETPTCVECCFIACTVMRKLIEVVFHFSELVLCYWLELNGTAKVCLMFTFTHVSPFAMHWRFGLIVYCFLQFCIWVSTVANFDLDVVL